jgi:hypothetical protein
MHQPISNSIGRRPAWLPAEDEIGQPYAGPVLGLSEALASLALEWAERDGVTVQELDVQ